MYILTVAPIIRGTIKNTLTYFSKDDIPIGTVVMATLRSREIPALVLAVASAIQDKTALKNSEYTLKKISSKNSRVIWTSIFLEAAHQTANYHAQNLGATLLALTPKAILDAHLDKTLRQPTKILAGKHFELLGTQGTTKERTENYRNLVRESFVRGESIFVCVPTEEDALRLQKDLGRGIENYTYVFTSSKSKRKILEKWQEACEEPHAILVIGTAQYLALPRAFCTVVLEEEQSAAWKTLFSPLLDLRVFVEKYAISSACRLVVGASVLRAETHLKTRRDDDQFGRIASHARKEIETLLVDPRKEEASERSRTGRRDFLLITSPLKELVQQSISQKERVLLICSRKGLSPITTCSDCGSIVRCPECENPLVIHKKESAETKHQFFLCHGCGFTRVPENNVNETCPQCHGWKLTGVGIGIDRVHSELTHLFPDSLPFVMDGDKIKTRAQAKKLIAEFEKSPAGILIATPMAIPLVSEVHHSAIVSIDSLFAIPDIRMPERIFSLILALREKTSKKMLVQTRADDTTILEQALAGNLKDFTDNELQLRKKFSYPPFVTIIKITLRSTRTEIESEMEHLKKFFNDYSPIVPHAVTREPKNIFRMHMLLKLPIESWPNSLLLAKLRALPLHISVEINPDHLL